MLDIGEDTGALVVYAPEDLAGQEIEIRPQGGVWTGVHTAVRTRHMGIRVVHAGVFGSLAAGSYDLRLRPVATAGAHRHLPSSPPSGTSTTAGPTVEVLGGRVTEARFYV